MHINEVEKQVGITKKNIRFYEKEGLLSPSRDSTNGYRTYSEEDISRLCQIKLLRKLSVPLEEIRTMLDGQMSLSEGMNRHLITLRSHQKNLETAAFLCEKLAQCPGFLSSLDSSPFLEEMEALEQEGVRFMNIKQKDSKQKKYLSAALSALVFLAFMAFLEGIMIWAVLQEPMPWFVVVLLVGFPLVFILGVLLVLYERIKEIKGGEFDDYRNY